MKPRRLSPKTKILITGGPTRAYLDDVRFLTNLSTGELSYHLCEKLQKKYDVELIVGPSLFPFEKLKLKKLTRIETNDEMLEAVLKSCETFRPDYAICGAAVLDFVPVKKLSGKRPSKSKTWDIKLKASPKIVDLIGERFPSIKRIGFKLEAEKQPLQLGKRILLDKGLFGLCLNFTDRIGPKDHAAWIYDRHGEITIAVGKKNVATAIANLVQ